MTHPHPQALLRDARWLQRLLRQTIRDPHRVDDLCQETIIKAHRHPDAGNRPFLAEIARNVTRSFLRRERTRSRAESNLDLPTPAPAAGDLAAEAESQRAAVTALLSLPDPYRETLLLRFMKGLSVRATAAEMRVPIETVRTRQKRGLEQLRRRLEPRRHPSPGILGILLMKTKLAFAGLTIVTMAALWMGGLFTTPAPHNPEVASTTETPLPGQPAAQKVEIDTPAPERRPTAIPADEVATRGSLVVQVRYERDGRPAANVGVRVRTHELVSRIPRLATTDGRGEVRFDDIRAGMAQVELAQHVNGSIAIKPGGVSRLELIVPPGQDIYGIVTDSANQPIADAEILAVLGGKRPQWLQALTRTDAHGRFQLRDMHRLNVIGARADGFAMSDFLLVLTSPRRADHSAEIRLVLANAPATLRGTVVDADGRPAAGVWVKVGYDSRGIDRARRTRPPFRHLRTNSEGRFKAENLQPGDVQVLVHPRGRPAWKGQFTFQAGLNREARIQLSRGATLQGLVLDARGQPLPKVGVSVEGTQYPARCTGESDDRGRYRLTNVPPGNITITMLDDQGARGKATVEIRDGQTLVHDLELIRPPSIRGRLVDEDGHPRTGWFVGASGLNQRTKTGKDGAFTIANCEEKAYRINFFEKPGFVPAIQQVAEVRPSTTERVYTIRATDLPEAMILGQVLGADNRPLPGVSMTLYQLAGHHMIPVNKSDAEGRLQTIPLPAGRYSLTLAHPNHRTLKKKDISVENRQNHDLGRIPLRAR